MPAIGVALNAKAILIENASDLLNALGWSDHKNQKTNRQRSLFLELSEEENSIIKILEQNQDAHIDSIVNETKLNHSTLAKALLNLEINGIISALPGNRYRIL